MCDWFVDNKLSILFGQDKTKSILFGTKHKLQSAKSLNIVYNGIEIKQHAKVKNLGCILDESLSGDSMALNIIDKINSCLKFLHRQNHFLTPPLHRLLCNALMEPLFDYACTAWFPNLSKKLRLRLQAMQNKCIRFCLLLDKMSRICVNEFLELHWLNLMFIIDTYNSFLLIFLNFTIISVLTTLMKFSALLTIWTLRFDKQNQNGNVVVIICCCFRLYKGWD